MTFIYIIVEFHFDLLKKKLESIFKGMGSPASPSATLTTQKIKNK